MFFYGNRLEQKQTKTKINDIVDLKERIEQEIKAMKKRETLENVFDGLVKRLNCRIDVNGDTLSSSMCRNVQYQIKL